MGKKESNPMPPDISKKPSPPLDSGETMEPGEMKILQPGQIAFHRDSIADKLDEMADIAELWKKNRAINSGPKPIRTAMLMLIDEIKLLSDGVEK